MWCMCKKTKLILFIGVILIASYILMCTLSSNAKTENKNKKSVQTELIVHSQQEKIKIKLKKIISKLERKENNAKYTEY
jgi:predicted negative regulator of RcsB-dependent stress response